jgi:hypothetical protein
LPSTKNCGRIRTRNNRRAASGTIPGAASLLRSYIESVPVAEDTFCSGYPNPNVSRREPAEAFAWSLQPLLSLKGTSGLTPTGRYAVLFSRARLV